MPEASVDLSIAHKWAQAPGPQPNPQYLGLHALAYNNPFLPKQETYRMSRPFYLTILSNTLSLPNNNHGFLRLYQKYVR
ncbi:hypothetical protein VN97_g3155 [Penicillium thymicola]|uniref:Uncharacterized protein n=1 Tax=Penicillium thymicola TaxID=293382 RepID=A0AAI9XAS8_PENTH|nr:hypothetical protein VN97_g3155 [Penicillium thymicola]